MLLCFVGAWLTAGRAGWREVHETLGLSLAALAAFRVVWGFVGSRYARFATFVPTPGTLARYLREWPYGWSKRYLGHSPAGACRLLLGLLLVAVLAATGRGWPAVHAAAGWALLGLAVLSLCAAVWGSWRSGENRLRSMLTGTCVGTSEEAAGPASLGARVAWLLPAGLLALWCYRWAEV
jgi:cytochrome b